ncbi:MAG: MFS transporter [Alphaproteobacteria bacterium]
MAETAGGAGGGADEARDVSRAPDAAGDPAPGGMPAGAWVTTTYFAEGFPYSVVNALAEILFKEMGASLQTIGLTSLFHLPWNLKFLWGPFLDAYETKRRWLVGTEVALSVALLALAALSGESASLALLSVSFLLVAILSATHDMAIDGYYLEALDARGQSAFVGYRAMAYRFAGMLVGGPLLVVAGSLGWTGAWLVTAAVMVALTLVHAFGLPRVERRRLPAGELFGAALRSPWPWLALAGTGLSVALALAPADGSGRSPGTRLYESIASLPVLGAISLAEWVSLVLLLSLVGLLARLPWLRARLAGRESAYATAFVDFLDQPRVAWILAFIVTFRAGESFLTKMRWPFLRDQMGMTLDQYGIANGTIGVTASFLATFFGGWLISRQGLRRWLWPFTLAQNGLHLLYAWLAMVPASSRPGPAVTSSVIAVEQFGAGLGTAVLMVYIMRCCNPAHKAAHMAILTALMSVSFTIAGVCSGFLAESMGFGNYFLFTFLVTIPSMALMFFLPHMDDPPAARTAE